MSGLAGLLTWTIKCPAKMSLLGWRNIVQQPAALAFKQTVAIIGDGASLVLIKTV